MNQLWIYMCSPSWSSLPTSLPIKRLFSSSLSDIRVVSSAYLTLLIFLLVILIPACASSSPAFLMMYSAYKLNKRVTVYSLEVLLSWFGTSLLFHVQLCYFLNCIQMSQEAGQVVWYSHLFKNFPQFILIHTIKDIGIVNKAIDVFLELSFFMIKQMLAIWFLVPLPFLNLTWTSGSSQFTYCWSLA